VFEFDIKGLAQLDQALKDVSQKVERNILRGGLLAAAKVVEAEAKRIVKAEAYQSGSLYDSIRASTYTVYRRLGGIPAATVKAGGRSKGKETSKKRAAFYAHMVEFGTKPHVIKARTRAGLSINGRRFQSVNHPGVQGIRFMTRAIDTQTQAAIAAFSEKVRDRIEKAGIDIPESIPAGDLDDEG
jgi:HK97 gp10 family phage protein